MWAHKNKFLGSNNNKEKRNDQQLSVLNKIFSKEYLLSDAYLPIIDFPSSS